MGSVAILYRVTYPNHREFDSKADENYQKIRDEAETFVHMVRIR